MAKNRKLPTKKEMINMLRKGEVSLPPISFRFLQGEIAVQRNRRLDALVEASWGQRTARFAVEFKALSTPKAFQDGLSKLKTSVLPRGYLPMLILPFLGEQQLQELEDEGISGIDLCGNGMVVVPWDFAIFRTGAKNRFTTSVPIKNIYRRKSSMVGRVFLLRSRYEAVEDVWEEINWRSQQIDRRKEAAISLSTVSKALKALEEDLIIVRDNTIRLLQLDKLLQKLSENYSPPYVYERVRLKIPQGTREIIHLLGRVKEDSRISLAATGRASVNQYAVMQRGDPLSVYCSGLDALLEALSGSQSDRFPNLELIETQDETVYFDSRIDRGFSWASPVQVYLELVTGDKRDQETAKQVKSYIMDNLRGGLP